MLLSHVKDESEWERLVKSFSLQNFVNATFVSLMKGITPNAGPLRLTTIGVYSWCPKCGKVVRVFSETECPNCKTPFHPQTVIIKAVTWVCPICKQVQKFDPFGWCACACGVRHFYAAVLRKLQKLIRTGDERTAFKAIVDTLMPYHTAKQPQPSKEGDVA